MKRMHANLLEAWKARNHFYMYYYKMIFRNRTELSTYAAMKSIEHVAPHVVAVPDPIKAEGYKNISNMNNISLYSGSKTINLLG